MRLTDRVAVVTGGTSGIGRAVAQRLLDEGAAAVVITGRDARRGAEVADQLGKHAHFRAQDVVREEQWPALLDEVIGRFGRLDILVNNAGSSGGDEPQDPAGTTLPHWRTIMADNLDSVFLGCRAAVAVMGRATPGSIVNMSSTAALMSTPRFVAYGAAKAAVTHLTRSVAVHCARTGLTLRCNSVHPAMIDTELGASLLQQFDADPQRARDGYLTRVPLGELGRPEDVAGAVAYLASDDSRYVTGTQLVVSGGLGA
ncbi:SDR family NAD(P)-dependent oxidoreductase [Actinoplanes palleronii]|uniref:Short-chain dehydrogenase n=1 Tax=Actinoplanes palleronii TaxID=113570 RepID=A0ABQ4BP44_9ACTN|nr:glucose 1-dehydrogenase [Actinoplanes palleronii]GIE72439.1 short-chain dehydrogenase [Actinoplanes palleronii]